jgi:hypothetical protein
MKPAPENMSVFSGAGSDRTGLSIALGYAVMPLSQSYPMEETI